MKWSLLSALVVAGTSALLVGCASTPVQTVGVPRADDPNAYRPMPMYKPLPPVGEIPGLQPGYGQPIPQPGMPMGQPMPGGVGGGVSMGAPMIKNEGEFVAAYAKRAPRIMVFVNRTIQGDALPKDGLEEVIRLETRQGATGAVNVANSNSVTGSGQSTSAGPGGASASNTNINRQTGSSFSSGGPAEYTSSTSVKLAADKFDVFGASTDDYQMIESSLVRYFDNSGRVRIMDSEAARAKLTREQVLRIENGDPQANRLLATELQADMLIRVTAKPTRQASVGNAVRLIAKAVSTTDARNMGTAFVDMPLPISKTNINIYTRYLSEELMGQMAQKWAQPPQFDPVEVRIYKAAGVDDSLKIRQWMQKTPGVASVQTNSATGGSNTSYASFAVGFGGAPEDLYFLLKDGIGMSSGLKAVDLQNNTISLEVTGPMNLVTTTRHVETTTMTETRTTEERRIEPISPAVNPGGTIGR